MNRKHVRYFLFWDTVFDFLFAFNHSFYTEYKESFQNILSKWLHPQGIIYVHSHATFIHTHGTR